MFLETNESEYTTVLNIQDTAKAVLRGKFIAIQAYLRKIEIFQIKNLMLHGQVLDEQQPAKPRVSRRKEITKITEELNDTESRKTIQRINKYSGSFFEKTKKINKTISRLIKKKKERTQ